jgi:hypothetical protein
MSVIRVRHDKNYVSIKTTTVLADPTISLKAKGLWSYCMTRPNDWEFNASHLATISPDGIRSIYKILKELIKHGYCKREQRHKPKGEGKGKEGFQKVLYTIYESREEEEKEDFVLGPNVHARNVHGRKSTLPSIESNQVLKEIHKEGRRSPSPPSADAELLYVFFWESIKKRNPKHKEPNKGKWLEQLDLLLRVDGRDLEETKQLLTWSETHDWWQSACMSPKALRSQYDRMVAQRNTSEKKELVRKNRAFALTFKERYPEEFKGLSFNDKFAINSRAAKEIPFNLPEETFRNAFAAMFGQELDHG